MQTMTKQQNKDKVYLKTDSNVGIDFIHLLQLLPRPKMIKNQSKIESY